MHSIIYVVDVGRNLLLLRCQDFAVKKMHDVQALSRSNSLCPICTTVYSYKHLSSGGEEKLC